MNRFGVITGVAVLVLAPIGATAQHVMVQPDSLKWTAAPPVLPKGAQIAVLYGDPDKPEPFVFRLKFPAGYKVAAHIHPNDYDLGGGYANPSSRVLAARKSARSEALGKAGVDRPQKRAGIGGASALFPQLR